MSLIPPATTLKRTMTPNAGQSAALGTPNDKSRSAASRGSRYACLAIERSACSKSVTSFRRLPGRKLNSRDPEHDQHTQGKTAYHL